MLHFIKELFQIFSNSNNWNLENIISLISILLVAIGGFFALFQWVSANKIKRAEFINQIIKRLRFNKDMIYSMHIIEYDDSCYGDSFHNNKKGNETRIDKFLSYLCYICYMKQMGIIHKKEFAIFEYELVRTCSSHSVCAYLWNLYHFSKSQNTNCTYQLLIDYGIKNKLIDKNCFMDSATNKFTKYLNF